MKCLIRPTKMFICPRDILTKGHVSTLSVATNTAFISAATGRKISQRVPENIQFCLLVEEAAGIFKLLHEYDTITPTVLQPSTYRWRKHSHM